MSDECRVCSSECSEENMLVCEKCDRCVHYKCTKLPVYMIAFFELQQDAFFCEFCVKKLPDYTEKVTVITKSLEPINEKKKTRPSKKFNQKSQKIERARSMKKSNTGWHISTQWLIIGQRPKYATST